MNGKIEVAIVGAGPAGCTLAALDRPEVLAKGFAKMGDWHRAWTEVIEYFYDGRM